MSCIFTTFSLAEGHSPRVRDSLTRALTDDMGDASEDWQAVGDVSVGDVVGSYDPVTGQWMCGRYDAMHAGGWCAADGEDGP